MLGTGSRVWRRATMLIRRRDNTETIIENNKETECLVGVSEANERTKYSRKKLTAKHKYRRTGRQSRKNW